MYLGNCEQFEECGQVARNEAAGSLGQIVKAESRAKRLTLFMTNVPQNVHYDSWFWEMLPASKVI